MSSCHIFIHIFLLSCYQYTYNLTWLAQFQIGLLFTLGLETIRFNLNENATLTHLENTMDNIEWSSGALDIAEGSYKKSVICDSVPLRYHLIV